MTHPRSHEVLGRARSTTKVCPAPSQTVFLCVGFISMWDSNVHIPWSRGGVESAVPKPCGWRLGVLRFPHRKVGCWTGEAKRSPPNP